MQHQNITVTRLEFLIRFNCWSLWPQQSMSASGRKKNQTPTNQNQSFYEIPWVGAFGHNDICRPLAAKKKKV